MRHKLVLTAAALVAVPALAACGGNASSGSSAAGSGCKPAHTFSTVQKGTLLVSSFDLPPFTKFQGTTLTGVDADILAGIAKKECLTVTGKPLDAANVIPAVQNGRTDVAAGDWYRTAERDKVVDLSDPLYLDQMGVISKDGTRSIPALKGKKVGTVEGYLWVSDVQKYLGAGVSTYPTSTAMWQDLQNGRIEIALDSYAASVYTNTQNKAGMKIEVAEPDEHVAASQQAAQSAFPVSKSNPDLLKALNADIAAMHSDGTIKQILEKHGLDGSAADVGDPRLIK